MSGFPHLGDSAFPDLGNVDVYKYRNEYDYSKFDATQMSVTLCSVPWDMGEAHVGQRTISGIGNVVYFENGADGRDAWLDARDDKLRFQTKYRRYHDSDVIDVPVPFDVCAKYNYCYIEYGPLPAANAEFLDYETDNGVVKWFYFIRDFERKSNNTTRLGIKRDIWQTIVYDVDIPYMMLERGHAPMSQVSVADYLAAPCESTRYLMAEDVNFGEPSLVRGCKTHAINSSAYVCFASAANPRGDWVLNTPATSYYSQGGAPGTYVFAVATGDYAGFMEFVETSYPQFKSTVQAVFFAPAELVTLGDSFSFAGDSSGVTCHDVSTPAYTHDFGRLSASDFGYPAAYADVAKLYTAPYAHLELTDEKGNVTTVRIEDTAGSLSVTEQLSVAYPDVSILARLSGLGGSASSSVTFQNLSTHAFANSGKWYEHLLTWDVPTFAVYQDAGKVADYSTHYDRVQARLAASNEQASANASASTEQTNATNNANTVISNGVTSATVTTDNATLQVACNSANTATNNSASTLDTTYSNGLNKALQAWGAGYTRHTVNNEIDAAYASAAVGATGGTISGVASAVGNLMSGNIAGGISGLVGAAATGATTAAQTVISANLTTLQAEESITYSQNQLDETNGNNSDKNALQISTAETVTSNTNSMISATAANSASAVITTTDLSGSTAIANAENTYGTAIANAARDYETATSAITNELAQRGIDAPARFGNATADAGTLRPQMVQVNVVTQNDGAIAMAGDQFLRYGYAYNGAWKFEGFNLMPKFTYWQCADLWMSGLQIPDLFMDELRYLLMGGVTVWHDPEDIGTTSIYENVEG